MSYTVSSNSPSAGRIAWAGVHIVFNGVNYAIADGDTANKYVYWAKATPTVMQTSATYPTLAAEDCVVFLNKAGVATSVLDMPVTDGGLIVPGTVTADAIAARTITTNKLLVVPESICPDPSFQDTAFWGGTLWETAGWIVETAVAVNPTYLMGVPRALCLNPGITGRKHVWSSEIDYSGSGQSVRLRFKYANNSGQNCYVTVRCTNVAGGVSDVFSIVAPHNGGVYASHSSIATLPAGTKTVEFIVYNDGAVATTGQCYVGDVRLDLAASADLIVDGAVTADKIAANSVTATHIIAGAITAEKIAVLQLSAISANLGTITAGNITLDASGFIRGGAVSATSGTGIWMGYDGGAYKFRVGTAAGARMTWDGSAFNIFDSSGNLTISSGVVNYSLISGKPTSLSSINSTEAAKLSGVATGATRNVFRGAWSTGATYEVGDITMDAGYGWSATAQHVASAVNKPPTWPTASNAFWTAYTIKGDTGPAGANGNRTAVLEMYRNSAAAPTTFPSGDSTYTWSTGQFTAPATVNGWSLTPPAPVANQDLYVVRQVYSDSNTTATSLVGWAATTSRVSAASGEPGVDGINGARTAYAEVYQWSVSTPTLLPAGTSTYTWATGGFTAPSTPNGWSLTPGAHVPGQTLWACGVRLTNTTTVPTDTLTWNTTTAFAVGAAGANGATGAAGLNFNDAKPFYTDPTFQTGNAACAIYSNGSNVVLVREAKQADSPYTDSGYNIRITTSGPTYPGLGGFANLMNTRANSVFVQRLVAKVPVGYSLADGSNWMGDGGSTQWLSPQAGTGKFEEYLLIRRAGPTDAVHPFQSTGHIYLTGPEASAGSPVSWYIAYSNVFDFMALGTGSVTATLSNAAHSVPTDKDGNAGNFAGAATTMSIFNGLADDSVNWTVAVTPSGGITGSLAGKTYTVTAMTTDVGTVDLVASRAGFPSITSRFTVTKAKQGTVGLTGAASTAYWLSRSVSAIQKSSLGVYSPSTVTFAAMSQTGTGAPAPFAGRFEVLTSTDGVVFTQSYLSYTNETSTTYTVPAGIKALRVNLFLDATWANLLDYEIIPVVSDGKPADLISVVGVHTNYSNDNASFGITVNGTVYSVVARGHTLQTVNPATGAVTLTRNYDTYGNPAGLVAMAADLAAVPTGHIVILATYDASGITPDVRAQLRACGSGQSSIWASERRSHAFIGQKGSLPGSAYEKDSALATAEGTSRVSASFTASGLVKNGATGATLTMVSDRAASFTATDGALDAAQADLVFTAQTHGLTAPTFAWSFSGLTTNPAAATGATQTITAAQFGSSKSAVVTVTVDGTFASTMTIVRLEKSTAAAGATVGAEIGVNLAGQITPANASTYIADAAIGAAQIGSLALVGTSNFSVKSSLSGQRMEMDSRAINIFDSGGILRVQIGDLSA